jgi:hypothetical protein
MIDQDHPRIAAISDVLERMDRPHYASQSISSLLDAFERGRLESCEWLAGLSDDQLQRAADHETAGEITVSNLLHYWPWHDIAHLRHLQRMLRSVLQHQMGNAAEFDI